MLHERARGTCSNPIGFSRHQRAAEEMWKQIQCGSAKAQHCSSMGWWTLVWRAALRAWAPFVVDVVKATHCAAFMQRAPTAAPLADHSLWVRRVWSEAAAAAAMEPGSTSGNGQTLRLAALYRPASRRALGIIGRFGRSTRCFDSVARWAVVAPRWLRWLPRALLASSGQRSTSFLCLAGTGRSVSIGSISGAARMRGLALGGTI